jgi:hypothetical protein
LPEQTQVCHFMTVPAFHESHSKTDMITYLV